MDNRSFKRKLGERYIKYKIRTNRGATFTAEIDSLKNALQTTGVAVLMINTYFHVLTPLWVLPALWLTQKVIEYCLGLLDERVLHWWHFENEYNSRNLNPWNREVLDRIINIENKL